MSGDAKRRAAFSGLALAAHLFGTHITLAGSATWRESGTNGTWHDAANWIPATIPNGPADIATFGSTTQNLISLSANTDVNGIVFNVGASMFAFFIGNNLTLSGSGVTNNSAAIQSLVATGASSAIRFTNSATAGNANVQIGGQGGGTVFFTGSSTGGAARLFANSTGSVDISGLATSGMTAGLIAADDSGSNFFRLGSKTLTVGGANLDSTVSGIIADGGAAGGVGGSIVKVGTGTLTYAGSAANTYTGTTFVNEGTLVLNKSVGVDAVRGPLVIGDGLGAAGTAVLRKEGGFNVTESQLVTVNGDGRFEVTSREDIGSLTVNRGEIALSADLDAYGPLAMTGGTIEGNGTISLFHDMIPVTSASDGAPATVSARVFLPVPASSYMFAVSDGPGPTDLHISGEVAGGSLVKAGGGVMVLSGTNSFGGSTTISGGTLSISSDANLGTPLASPAADHLVFDGGTLRATETLQLSGNRGITLNTGGGTIEVTSGHQFVYDGVISGSGGLAKTGPGLIRLIGSSTNTYLGTTTVKEGVLALTRPGVQSIAGPLTIGDVIGAEYDARLFVERPAQIADTAPVTIQPDGALITALPAALGEMIGPLTLLSGNVSIAHNSFLSVNGPLAMTGGTIAGGTVSLGGNLTSISDSAALAATISSSVGLGGATRTFTVNDGPGAVDLNISGFIYDGSAISDGGITKTGAGTLALAGGNPYSGPTTVVAGTLILSGIITNSTTVVANGATLQGAGFSGPLTINSGGTLVPGLSVGTLTTGKLTLNSGSTSSFELAVANVVGGGVNDLVTVNGDLVLGGTLAITTLPGFGPGAYPLFTYTNTAVNQGLTFESSFLATRPGSTIEIDAINKRVIANITALQALPGDYNQNGTVDAADYVVWRDKLGSGTSLPNDDTAGVGHDDYTRWRARFGQSTSGSAGASVSAHALVPEPSAIMLLSIAAMLLGTRQYNPLPYDH